MNPSENLDAKVTAGFADEWTRFDQTALSDQQKRSIFENYFDIFPWERVDGNSHGADFGCGSGRWAAFVAPRVRRLSCVDASPAALLVARRILAPFGNCDFHETSIENASIEPDSLDFAYSLGVLHHMPDTAAGLSACVSRLKPGAPFLLYLYYNFDNRPAPYRWLWRTSELLRFVISRAPPFLRYWLSQICAALIYWPLARIAKLLERAGVGVSNLPLSYYRHKPFYVLRNDALDRFGTRLEQRFSRAQIGAMMTHAGLVDVRFSEHTPFWCAVGFRRDGSG
jgi:SAM-dependent methyltransferase